MTSEKRASLGRILVWVACIAGSVHAGFSVYWTVGGQWLLATVGQWAVTLSAEAPFRAGLAIGMVAVGKLLAAVIPVAVAYGRFPRRKFWRAVSWVGGLLLVAYGGVNMTLSAAVLGGAIRPADGYDVEAMMGHAWLWDPLFFIWGLALVLSLWCSLKDPPQTT